MPTILDLAVTTDQLDEMEKHTMVRSRDPRGCRRPCLLVVVLVAALAVAGALLSPGHASAACVSGLFGATGSNGVDANLYCIDPTTGASTLIGPVLIGQSPVSITGLAFHPATHVLYAVTGADGNPPGGELLTIDPNTGAATDIGSLGLSATNCTRPPAIVGDISFRADGTLFGAGPCGPSPTGNLYTIDLATGAATFVGGIPYPDGNRRGFGLSFLPLNSPLQQLYLFPQQTDQNVYIIDPASGAIVQTIALSGGNEDAVDALTTNRSGALLLGVKTNRSSSPTGNSLIAVDPASGAITVRGALPGDMDGIALDPDSIPSQAPIPTLSEWGQILMAGMLVATAIWMIRRRRSEPA